MQHHNWLDEESEDDQYDINNNLIQESAYKIESFPSKDVGSKHKINELSLITQKDNFITQKKCVATQSIIQHKIEFYNTKVEEFMYLFHIFLNNF